MAKVLLAVTFSLTLVRTCLVLGAVCSRHGGVVGRAAQGTRRMLHAQHRHNSSHLAAGAPKTRSVAVGRRASNWVVAGREMSPLSPAVDVHACLVMEAFFLQKQKSLRTPENRKSK